MTNKLVWYYLTRLHTLRFLAVTIVFSSFALALGSNEKLRIVIKVIAGLTWFVLALTQFYFFGGSHPPGVPMMFLFTWV